MYKGAGRRPKTLLAKGTADQLAIVDNNVSVVVREIFLVIVFPAIRKALEVDELGDDVRKDLLASPERLWLDDGGLRKHAIPVLHVHQEVHQQRLQGHN